MTESGKSLSNSKKYCSVLEKISKINDVKQNEKHPFIINQPVNQTIQPGSEPAQITMRIGLEDDIIVSSPRTH